jgi:hypothetical protein
VPAISRPAALHLLTGALGDARRGSKEEEAQACHRATLADRRDKIDTGDALGQGRPCKTRGPYQRHAVRKSEIDAVQRLSELSIAASEPEEVQVDGRHLARTALANESLDCVDCRFHGKRVDLDAKQGYGQSAVFNHLERGRECVLSIEGGQRPCHWSPRHKEPLPLTCPFEEGTAPETLVTTSDAGRPVSRHWPQQLVP